MVSITVLTGCTTALAEKAESAPSMATISSGIVKSSRTSVSLRRSGMNTVLWTVGHANSPSRRSSAVHDWSGSGMLRGFDRGSRNPDGPGAGGDDRYPAQVAAAAHLAALYDLRGWDASFRRSFQSCSPRLPADQKILRL